MMKFFSDFSIIAPNVLAIINKKTNTLAVINDKVNASENLNYIIGGLIVIVIVLVGNTLFRKK